ncbi:MAG TPA: tetratricopeptide repeat protein, partial [Beijerinckiaceae bacterium]|nr:tetratricopeptide repeat protein [Beijerinckiaceae bacterium]
MDLERWQKLSDAGIAEADKGDYAAAEVSLRQAYDVAKEMREADPRRAATANNLGFVLHAEGRPQDALPLYQESLSLREAALGPDHPSVAQSLSNEAEALRALGRAAEAEPLARRALAIRQAAL